MVKRLTLLIPLILILAGAFVVPGRLLAQGEKPPSSSPVVRQESSPEPLTVNVTPEMRQHSRILNRLYFAGQLFGALVLLLILVTGLSAKLRDLAFRITRRWWLAAILYAALFFIVLGVFSFPLSVYRGYVVPHQFGLSNLSFGGWMTEQIKELGMTILIGAPLAALALFGIQKVPRRWGFALWLGSIPITIFLVVIAPLYIEPVFNKFEPLRDEVLRERLLTQAGRAGISGGRVYQVDKSKQTKTMNAYVNGIGPSKRIVMWDTLLAKMNHDEVSFVMAHEMGHYVMQHLWKGIAFGFLVMLPTLLALQRIGEWGVVRFGARWKVGSPSDPAAVPWLLLVLSLLLFFLTPVLAGYSRRAEHQADVFALDLTRQREAGARAFIKLAEDSKVDPQPSPFVKFWRYSHPPLAERIEFALRYDK